MIHRKIATGPTTQRGGFSLPELLVLIGIVVVLLGLLVPMVSRIRAASRQAACLSQVRELGVAYTTYLADSERQGFTFDFSPQSSWVMVLRSRLRMGEQAYRCPAAVEQGSDFGTATMSWTLALQPASGPVSVTGSYGFNAWLLEWDPNGKGGDLFSGGKASDHTGMTRADSGRVPVFADCTWVDAWPRADDPTPPNLTDGDRPRQGMQFAPHENMMARFAISRHGQGPGAGISACFLDGHAEPVPLSGLKRLQWSSHFAPAEWDPPLPQR